MNFAEIYGLDRLIGKTVKNLYLGEGAEEILFECTDGTTYTYNTENDCCNAVWFSDLLGVEFLLYSPIIDIIDKDLDAYYAKDWGGYNYDAIDFYGVTFKTYKGYFDLVFRNSHNGYYGGSMRLNTEGLILDNASIGEYWKKVTKDIEE